MRPIFTLFAGAVFFSTFGVLIRALDVYFGPLMQTALRFAAAALVLAFLPIGRRHRRGLHGIWSPAGAAFMLCFPLMVVTFTYSALQIKAANALFLLYVGSILFSLIGGRVVYGEAIHARRAFAGVCALLGVACLADIGNPLAWSMGVAMGLLSGVFEGATNLLRRQLRHTDSRLLLLTQYIVSTALLVPLAYYFDTPAVHQWSVAALPPLLLFGTVLALGNLCLNYSFARLPLATATIIFSTELIFALALNAWFLNETPTGQEVVGAVAVALAVVLSVRSGR